MRFWMRFWQVVVVVSVSAVIASVIFMSIPSLDMPFGLALKGILIGTFVGLVAGGELRKWRRVARQMEEENKG